MLIDMFLSSQKRYVFDEFWSVRTRLKLKHNFDKQELSVNSMYFVYFQIIISKHNFFFFATKVVSNL